VEFDKEQDSSDVMCDVCHQTFSDTRNLEEMPLFKIRCVCVCVGGGGPGALGLSCERESIPHEYRMGCTLACIFRLWCGWYLCACGSPMFTLAHLGCSEVFYYWSTRV
jgi:hypothetical protein